MRSEKNKLPGISCYCPTFARPPSLIENTIKSFLDQDWLGPKELVILNDNKNQKYFYDHPEIRIINLDERIPVLGIKFNETIKLCKYDLLATWDDDDIFLKHRLSFSYDRLKHGYVFHTYNAFKEMRAYNIQEFDSYCHSTHLIHKNLFYDIGGYNELDIFYLDIKLMEKINSKIPDYSVTIHKNSEKFYIYRWHTTNSYHTSNFDPDGNISRDLDIFVSKNHIQSGNIKLRSQWSYNYYDFLPR